MAARATGKPKQASSGRASTKAGTSSPNATRAAKAAAKKSASAKRTGAKSATSGKVSSSSKPASSKYNDPVAQLLADQNEALRAELEQANARIRELEVLNKNVLNRIDWVIDSLQSVLEAKQ
jgi:hypothetical protein